MKTATAPQIIRRESHTEQLFFTSRPDFATRQALKAAGFRWNRVFWWRNVNQTAPIKQKQLSALLAPANDSEPDSSSVIEAAIA